MEVSLEDINMIIVWEMAETSVVPHFSIKKKIRTANYFQPKSFLKLN